MVQIDATPMIVLASRRLFSELFVADKLRRVETPVRRDLEDANGHQLLDRAFHRSALSVAVQCQTAARERTATWIARIAWSHRVGVVENESQIETRRHQAAFQKWRVVVQVKTRAKIRYHRDCLSCLQDF